MSLISRLLAFPGRRNTYLLARWAANLLARVFVGQSQRPPTGGTSQVHDEYSKNQEPNSKTASQLVLGIWFLEFTPVPFVACPPSPRIE